MGHFHESLFVHIVFARQRSKESFEGGPFSFEARETRISDEKLVVKGSNYGILTR
jgi:hypothetical protein